MNIPRSFNYPIDMRPRGLSPRSAPIDVNDGVYQFDTMDSFSSLCPSDETSSDDLGFNFSSSTPLMPALNTDSVRNRRASISVGDIHSYDAPFGSFSADSDFTFSARNEIRHKLPKDSRRDWIGEVLELKEKLKRARDISTKAELKSEMREIYNTFTKEATLIAKCIITEVELDDEDKTVRPVDFGGSAGEKFLYAGIFFKLGIDTSSIYGGDMFASKAAANEFKSIQVLQGLTKDTEIVTNFAIIVNYKGFRVLATSYLPIDGKESLIYGSYNGGREVYNLDKKFASMFKDVCVKLNLKRHTVFSETDFYGPGDIEAHIGHDKRYYVIDTARLFPALPPNDSLMAFRIGYDCNVDDKIHVFKLSSSTSMGQSASNLIRHFVGLDSPKPFKFGSGLIYYVHESGDLEEAHYNEYASKIINKEVYGDAILIHTSGVIGTRFNTLFRSEYVKSNPVPLCSDAFTSFDTGADKEINENEIREAQHRLFDKAIPDFCSDVLTGKVLVSNEKMLCDAMHERGINLRYLGKVRAGFKSDIKIERLVLREILFRTLKVLFSSELRQGNECSKAAVNYLNLIFGESEHTTIYWGLYLKTFILFKFGQSSLTEKEKKISYDLRTVFESKSQMVRYILNRLDISLEADFYTRLETEESLLEKQRPVEITDVVELVARVKTCGYPM